MVQINSVDCTNVIEPAPYLTKGISYFRFLMPDMSLSVPKDVRVSIIGCLVSLQNKETPM